MKFLLLLKKIQIENANAIAGMIYGFPAITHFVGFTHALSRKLAALYPSVQLQACAVVSHQQQIHKYAATPGQDAVFCLTRNPVTKEGISAPFNEEGRMHLTVSLLIQGDVNNYDIASKLTSSEYKEKFLETVNQLALTQRIAGGVIVNPTIQCIFSPFPDDYEANGKFIREQMRHLSRGYILVERSHLLAEHISSQPQAPLKAWLDFITLKSAATPPEAYETDNKEEKTEWSYLPKPARGWLVPMMAGYRAISKLFLRDKV